MRYSLQDYAEFGELGSLNCHTRGITGRGPMLGGAGAGVNLGPHAKGADNLLIANP